jgi:chromosome segregation ATPase
LQGAKVLTTLKPWAELISIAGAALLFFSWVVSNTLQQRYQAAKASVERAQSERRLYGELAQARQSIDSLAAEILNTRQGLRAVHAKVAPDSDATRLRHEEVVSSIASKKLNARQIDWGLRFCSNEQELAQALDSKDDSIGELNNVCKKMSSLREQKEEVFKQMIRRSRQLKNSTTKPHARFESLRVAIASACCLSSVRCWNRQSMLPMR